MFCKRIIAWLSFFVICFSIIPVAHAEEYISKNANYWEHLMHWAIKGVDGIPLLSTAVQGTASFLEGDICSFSDDGYHYGERLIVIGESPDESGYQMAKSVCKYCNKQFNCYVSDLQQSYEAQVEELPAQGIMSSGHLLWQPSIADCNPNTDNPYSANHFSVVSNGTTVYFSDFSDSDLVSYLSSNNGVKCSFSNYSFSSSVVFYFNPVIVGSYRRVESPFYSYSCVDRSGQFYSGSCDYIADASFVHYELTKSLLFSERRFKVVSDISGESIHVSFGNLYLYFPTYEIIPDSAIDVDSGDIYNIQSRPTSITGDYGIIGDNGQIIKIEGDKIVNETNNTIYNLATGETHTMSDWSYNYEDRSYTVTTETGDTITITYGDENVTIKEGDTIYNVYYLVDGSGSENPGPGPDVPGGCNHIWTETGRTEPTCTTAGKVTSTCSKCNQTKTETIPATGHNWVVDRTVQTTYDEEGNLLQQGYTIYSCSVCGEQYKDMEGTGPPGSEEEKSIWEKLGDLIGSGFGGIIEIIEAILGKILDALTSLVNMITDKFKGIVESILSIFDELPALFGGFLDFLAAIFPFLPPEITSILTFGVIAITFIGILKAVRR